MILNIHHFNGNNTSTFISAEASGRAVLGLHDHSPHHRLQPVLRRVPEFYLSADQDILTPSPASATSPPTALLAFVGTLCYGLTWAGGIIVNPIISRIEHRAWESTATPSSSSSARLWRLRALRHLTPRTITISGYVYLAPVAYAGAYSSGWECPCYTFHSWPQPLNTSPTIALRPWAFRWRSWWSRLSPVIRALLSSLGGRWTLRIYAAFNLVAGLPVAWLPAHNYPFSFIPSYTVVLGQTASNGATLLAASNAINAVSRVLTGYAGDRLGRQNTLILTLLLAALSVFAFWFSSVLAATPAAAFSLWLVFIVFYSCSAGGYYGLFPALVAEVFGIRQYAAVNAFILFVRGLGTMFGSPVGGTLLGGPEKAGTSAYAGIAYWDGALLMGATLCCAGVRWADGKGKGWKWIA
ncbi:monocarboxylate transporter [Apiospora phragmitis]|uniref:Monocarboxylate transporter n=1 Tax=Apiospora phragmitis TaxID=2905665 RepID=A0ABR1SWR6_9PEZI